MGIKADTTSSLADQLFNAESVNELSTAVGRAYKPFKVTTFSRIVLREFPKLALKERINCLVQALTKYLPNDFERVVDILERALPAPLDPTRSDDDFGQFIWVVPGEYVAKHGCRKEYLQQSLAFLKAATMRFSSEAAVRPFLRDFPEQTMAFVHDCAMHDNYHVRRLASEGIRPYLPWALRVRIDVAQVIEVLTTLHADRTRYVTRSVANTLNDLSKDGPELVIRTLRDWRRRECQESNELAWMTGHALRTLINTGHAGALETLGYPTQPAFRLSGIRLAREGLVGGNLEWSASLRSERDQRLRIALRVYFLKANGSHIAKVFSVKNIGLQAGQSLQLRKRLSFRPITTRALYLGVHHVELLVNGVARGKRSFILMQ